MKKLLLIALLISSVGYLSADVNFCGRTSSIRIGSGATLDLNTSMSVDEGTIRIDNGGSLTDNDTLNGNHMLFSQGILEYHDFETFFTGRLDMYEGTHDVELFADGDLVRAEPGTIIDGIRVEAGISATVIGQPFMDDTIYLRPGAQLYLGIQSKLNKNIVCDTNTSALNWVGVSLEDDLCLEDNIKLDHVGTISFAGHRIKTGGDDLTWSAANQWWHQAADFELGGDLTLASTIVIDNDTAYFYGNGHTLNMAEFGIFVTRGTTLRMEDLIINGLKGAAKGGGSSAGALMLDDGATIEFKNVTILMNNAAAYEFNRGTLNIIKGGYLKILPGGDTTYKFEYSTDAAALNIQSNAKLIVARDAEFQYDCATGTEIAFVDDTSEIYIENGTFSLEASRNWTFSVGTMVVDGKSTITMPTTDYGVTVETTADIVVMPGATMLLSGSGTLTYNE